MSGQADHLRGKDGRGAEDDRPGSPRPDEVSAPEPPGVQATHAGMPTNDPAPPQLDESGVGRDATITGHGPKSGAASDRGRYQGRGRDTEGAFGEEEPGRS